MTKQDAIRQEVVAELQKIDYHNINIAAIHRELRERGYDVGYTTVNRVVGSEAASILFKRREATRRDDTTRELSSLRNYSMASDMRRYGIQQKLKRLNAQLEAKEAELRWLRSQM